MGESSSCLMNLKSKMNILTSAEQKIGKYVIENYDKVLHLTVTELAEQADSSEATVVRFCRHIGYKGYQEFKINLAKDEMAPFKHLNTSLEMEDTPKQIISKIISLEIETLQETIHTLDEREIERAARAILNADRIVFFGSGGSGIVGLDAVHKLLKIGIQAFAQRDGDIQAMSASLLKEGDVAFGISHSGANASVTEALKLAKSNGALTIGLSTLERTPMAKYCDILLLTSIKETIFRSESVTARIAQLSVIDILVAAISLLDYKNSYKAIQKTRNATANHKL